MPKLDRPTGCSMHSYVLSRMILAASTTIAACASTKASTPLSEQGKPAGIYIAHALPKVVPGGTVPFPHSEYLFAEPEGMGEVVASMLMPLPFVTEIASAQINQERAREYEKSYVGVDPYAITLAAVAGNALFSATPGDTTLYPYVVIQEGADEIYRASLILQVTRRDWMGRYLYHLSIKIPKKDFPQPSEAELAAFAAQLAEGASQLTGLIVRDAAGELKALQKVDFGSLNVVSIGAGGLIAPELELVRGADLIEETSDHVIVRGSGDPSADVDALGLAFGVHYFHRDQLHTLKKY